MAENVTCCRTVCPLNADLHQVVEMVFVDAFEIDAVCGFQYRIGDVPAEL
jgi:hypothetical protein